jgi:GR25 family glycosyltransferase involved in LPS biosynthesis
MNAFIGMQCYFITLDGAKRFLQEANTIHLHIDLWIIVYKKVHGLDIMCLSKYVVRQRASKTDIQDFEGCALCNVTNDFPKTHRFISLEEFWLLRAMELALGITAVYAAYKYIKKA